MPTPTQYGPPSWLGYMYLAGVCLGPDGNIWVQDAYPQYVFYASQSGVWGGSSSYVVDSYVASKMIVGSDARLWVAGQNQASPSTYVFVAISITGGGTSGWNVGTIQIAGGSGAPTATTYTSPFNINDFCLGPDGNMWAACPYGLEYITPSGTITSYTSPDIPPPVFTAICTDGTYLYAADSTNGVVRKFTTAFSELGYASYSVPGDVIYQMALGPDGNIWMGGLTDNTTYQVTPLLTVTSFPIGTTAHYLMPCIGPDGYLWFSSSNSYVYKVTGLPSTPVFTGTLLTGSNPVSICAGTSSLWVADNNNALWAVAP